MPITTTGMDAVIASLLKQEQDAEPKFKRAVKDGAQYVANCLRENAPVGATGSLAKSIKPGPVKYSSGDGYYCEVKPVGNHPDTGESLAKVGNVLEYGRSYGDTVKPPLGWFYPTVKKAEPDALMVMQASLEAD